MEWTLKNIVVIVIITLVAIILIASLFGPKIGLLNIAAKSMFKMGEWFMPTNPPEKLKPITGEDISEELINSYNSLVNALEYGKISDKDKCLIRFDALPSNFNKDVIDINYIEDSKECKFALNKQGVLLNKKTIKDIVPCTMKKENINKFIDFKGMEIKENEFGSVKILGENSNLLYKYDKQHICFLENCGNDCLQQMFLIDKKIDFCDISYKEIYTDVFYDNTYYGNLGDWELIKVTSMLIFPGKKWYYKGNNEDVAYYFKEEGTGIPQFKDMFLKSIKKKTDGMWYNGYYGKKEDWCHKKKEGIEDEKWIYTGNENVKEKEIKITKKLALFGPVEIKECGVE